MANQHNAQSLTVPHQSFVNQPPLPAKRSSSGNRVRHSASYSEPPRPSSRPTSDTFDMQQLPISDTDRKIFREYRAEAIIEVLGRMRETTFGRVLDEEGGLEFLRKFKPLRDSEVLQLRESLVFGVDGSSPFSAAKCVSRVMRMHS